MRIQPAHDQEAIAGRVCAISAVGVEGGQEQQQGLAAPGWMLDYCALAALHGLEAHMESVAYACNKGLSSAPQFLSCCSHPRMVMGNTCGVRSAASQILAEP